MASNGPCPGKLQTVKVWTHRRDDLNLWSSPDLDIRDSWNVLGKLLHHVASRIPLKGFNLLGCVLISDRGTGT